MSALRIVTYTYGYLTAPCDPIIQKMLGSAVQI